VDITLKAVTLASGKGALGTWRSWAGQRRTSEEPAFLDEPEGTRAMSGVDASQRLSFLMFGKTFRGKPGSEPYSGNPTVRDRRGACGNVGDGGTRHPPRISKERVLVTLCLKSRAPQFYPDPGYPADEETYRKATRLVPTQLECGIFACLIVAAPVVDDPSCNALQPCTTPGTPQMSLAGTGSLHDRQEDVLARNERGIFIRSVEVHDPRNQLRGNR